MLSDPVEQAPQVGVATGAFKRDPPNPVEQAPRVHVAAQALDRNASNPAEQVPQVRVATEALERKGTDAYAAFDSPNSCPPGGSGKAASRATDSAGDPLQSECPSPDDNAFSLLFSNIAEWGPRAEK